MDVKLKRTLAFVGHAQCGKTSLTESILFVCKEISRKGDVMQGNTVSDFSDDEKERRSSINSSVVKAAYNNHRLQIIDTPGYMDFIGETIAALHISDSAVVVIDAVNSVEVGTEDVWQRLDDYQLPRVIFINKCDKEGAKVDAVIKDIKEQLSTKAVIIDLDSSDLIETVAETDDALLEKYLEEGSLSKEEISGALHKAISTAKLFPIIIGDTSNDKGVKELLDAIVNLCPSPLEHRPFTAKVHGKEETMEITPAADGPFAGLIFKSVFDPHLGHIALMRIIRGKITGNTDCFNTTQNSKEHIGTINMMQGKEQLGMPEAGCGDIVALSKLKVSQAWDTLAAAGEKFVFQKPVFPEPSISASIKPKTRADEEKISTSLHRLCEEDQTFSVSRNKETKELIISGVGDLHLKVIVDRMKQRYHVDVDLGTPKVTYRETITKKGRFRYKYKKQSGGRGQYGDVDLEVEPLPVNEEEYEFVNKIFGGAIPRNYIPSVEKGVKQTILDGVLAGYPIHHIRVSVVDGSYHDVDSSDMAFQIAGSMAMKEAIKAARPILLEPIMEANVVVTDDFIGPISGDVSSRRGRIMGTEAKGKKSVIKVHVPLSEMFTYASDLRSMTGGRGSYTMRLSHYEPAPQKITDQVIASAQEAKK